MILILWLILSILAFAQFGPHCRELEKREKILMFIILGLGGPFIMLGSLLLGVMDTILPEGWDDDDS